MASSSQCSPFSFGSSAPPTGLSSHSSSSQSTSSNPAISFSFGNSNPSFGSSSTATSSNSASSTAPAPSSTSSLGFGSSAASTPSSASPLFGGSSSSPSPFSTSNIFGSSTSSSTAASATKLFGASSSGFGSTSTTGTNLFGSSSSGFGSTSTNLFRSSSSGFGSTSKASTNLFGSSSSGFDSNLATGTSLFKSSSSGCGSTTTTAANLFRSSASASGVSTSGSAVATISGSSTAAATQTESALVISSNSGSVCLSDWSEDDSHLKLSAIWHGIPIYPEAIPYLDRVLAQYGCIFDGHTQHHLLFQSGVCAVLARGIRILDRHTLSTLTDIHRNFLMYVMTSCQALGARIAWFCQRVEAIQTTELLEACAADKRLLDEEDAQCLHHLEEVRAQKRAKDTVYEELCHGHDWQSGKLDKELLPHLFRFIDEPIFVPKGVEEDDGYLIVVEYAAPVQKCYLVILDFKRIGDICSMQPQYQDI